MIDLVIAISNTEFLPKLPFSGFRTTKGSYDVVKLCLLIGMRKRRWSENANAPAHKRISFHMKCDATNKLKYALDPMFHTGKCIRRFGGITAYCRYFIDRKW